MKPVPGYPSLFQINTRVLLTEISRQSGKQATLDDIPDDLLDRIAARGFDWVWLLSVWQTGELSRKVSCDNPEWRREFQATLPDLQEQDIGGSGFAVADYRVPAGFGGHAALKRLRSRLHKRGLKLMLDFVPNHMGLDHPWIEKHPGYFIPGTEGELEVYPRNFFRMKGAHGYRIFAHGRDPYFPGWPDTVQLDYSNPATIAAMTRELLRISGQCDGLRCDMAMLVLPEVFERTWGRHAQPFWPPAISAVREKAGEFCFMAEVYWDMEWELQQLGFDYTYDKRLYDRLCQGWACPVREHLSAHPEYQQKLARFLENHDEPRAAATFHPAQHQAAAVITYTVPGLRFFHQGQLEGRTKRISPHLVRAPEEPRDEELCGFYERLLAVLRKPTVKAGEWSLHTCRPAWSGNDSWDAFIAHSWHLPDNGKILVVVNYAPHPGQCYLALPFSDLAATRWRFRDLMSDACYEREGDELAARGLYLDVPAWHYHVFEMEPLPASGRT
jgi:hypothetical protein